MDWDKFLCYIIIVINYKFYFVEFCDLYIPDLSNWRNFYTIEYIM